MFRFVPLVVILQLYCLYHAHKNNADQKWYWLVIFLPVVGCLFYLYYHFYNRQTVQVVSEGIKGVINTNYEVEKLEERLQATDSDLNKGLLADKYQEMQRYTEAIDLYESILKGSTYGETHIVKALVNAHYKEGNYAQAVEYAEKLEGDREFGKSEEKVAYAWSLHEIQETAKAETVFKEMNSSYSNYPQRMEYARFLNAIDRKDEAVAFLKELLAEFDQMRPEEKRAKRMILQNIQTELKNSTL